MRPLDPRLLTAARAARGWVMLTAAVQVVSTILLVMQAFWLAGAVAGVIGGAPAHTVVTPLLVLVAVLLGRAGAAALGARYAQRSAVRVIEQLRSAVLTRLDAGAVTDRSPADLTTLLTSGLDQLDGYLVRYLPQLIATSIVTPLLVLVVATQDWISAAIMVVTLPLVPFFMALVGWTTQKLSDERIATMRRLGDQVMDLVAGLPTLQALGRALPQAARVRAVGDAYRKSSSRVLRIAFLSGFVLELLTTIAVALVAVTIGMRMVHGGLDLTTGLTVLILAPEVYLPIRLVGQHYHASTDGIAAANAVLNLLDDLEPSPAPAVASSQQRPAVIGWREVSVLQPGRDLEAPHQLSGTARAGRVTALVGPNGSGKSTAVAVLLGLRPATSGALVGLDGLDAMSWRRQVAWVPQHPIVVAGTIEENIALIAPDPSADELAAAAARAGFADVVAEQPQGWATPLGEGGIGLSAGQRQRLALTRALILLDRGAHVLILDEPSAHLDPATERVVLDTLRASAATGAIVLVVAHRPTLVAAADEIITVSSSRETVPA